MKYVLSLLCLLSTPNVFGQDSQSDADLRRNIQTNQKITVQLAGGRKIKGVVVDVAATELALSTKAGKEVIPAARIQQVTRRRGDALWEGLIIGAAAGALMGAASNTMNDCDRNECGEKYVVPAAMAVGAAVGAGIDALWRHQQVLYRAPDRKSVLSIRFLTGRVTGARVSWSF